MIALEYLGSFFSKQKSDVSAIFSNFHHMVKTQFGVGIKNFKSDNAKDYFNQVLSPYFKKGVIIYEFFCISTPQQNGVAELLLEAYTDVDYAGSVVDERPTT